jgi:hypothetical protein
LLGNGRGGDAECDREQRGDDGSVFHDCSLKGLRVLVETLAAPMR